MPLFRHRESDREYWPTLDLQALNDQIAEAFTQAEANRAGGPLAYPKWFVRRFIAQQVLAQAGLIDSKVGSDTYQVFEDRSITDEDPDLDKAVERLLQKHHLTEPVQILVDGFTAPPRDT